MSLDIVNSVSGHAVMCKGRDDSKTLSWFIYFEILDDLSHVRRVWLNCDNTKKNLISVLPSSLQPYDDEIIIRH